MTHKALHPRDDIDRIYVSRKEGERGLTSIEDNVGVLIQQLEDKIKKSKERLITVASNSSNTIRINRRTTKTKQQKWEEKQSYGYFCRILVNSVKFLQKETPLSNSAEDKIHEWTPLMQMSWIGPFS